MTPPIDPRPADPGRPPLALTPFGEALLASQPPPQLRGDSTTAGHYSPPAFGPLDRDRPRNVDPGGPPPAFGPPPRVVAVIPVADPGPVALGLDPAAAALLAYVTGFADSLAGDGIVMGSVVARDLVEGAKAVAAAVADRPEPNAGQRAEAQRLVDELTFGGHSWDGAAETVARALAAEFARGVARGRVTS